MIDVDVLIPDDLDVARHAALLRERVFIRQMLQIVPADYCIDCDIDWAGDGSHLTEASHSWSPAAPPPWPWLGTRRADP